MPKPQLRLTLRYKVLLVTLGIGVLVSLAVFLNLTESKKATAATEILSSGAYIINMGITPQTYANGLKPYGMLFDLIVNHSVPVKWVIEPSKAKDGTDFTYSSVAYKGGPFIIPSEYINSTISSRISFWQSQGVQGAYTTSQLSVPVYTTITAFPVIIIDEESGNDDIIIDYYDNAGISNAGYVVGTPSGLHDCNDIWVNPHGDPTWATHSYLYNYVTVSKNFIWAQCHAVSVLEGVRNIVSPFERLNYLTTNALKCYSNGKCVSSSETHAGNSTSPYTYYYPADPIMQFMGTMDGACNGGSEKWYQPQAAGSGQWRPTTKRLVTTSNGTSPNEGVLMVYGPGFGDPANGYVMYEGGHSLNNGTVTERVAAQRAFFNFVLFAGITKKLTFSAYSVPSSFRSSETKPVSVTVTTGAGTAPYTYQWTSTIGGSFTNGTSASAGFTAPNTPAAINGALVCTVIDACGRQTFLSEVINVSENTLPVTLVNFTGNEQDGKILLNWITASEINNDYFTIERSQNGYDFSEIGTVKGAGNNTMQRNYSFTDETPIVGDNYYRLVQTDFDGAYEIFKTIVVRVTSAKTIINEMLGINPVPFNDQFTIFFSLIESESVSFMILNGEGKTMRTERVAAPQGYNSFLFDNLSYLPDGVYYVIMITSNGEIYTRKILNI